MKAIGIAQQYVNCREKGYAIIVPTDFEACYLLSKQVLALTEQLEAAERERDELRTLAEYQSKLAGINAARAQKAEAELARRDAAAGEPVGVVRENPDDIGLIAEFEVMPPLGSKLYAAAPPAVFPSASDASQGWKVNPEYLESVATLSCDADGVNPSLETVESVILALGAQQQKVVDLPAHIRPALIDVLTWIERLPVPTKSAAAKAMRLRKAISDIETACALYEVNSDE